MSWSFVGRQTTSNSISGATSGTVTLPGSVQGGDIIIMSFPNTTGGAATTCSVAGFTAQSNQATRLGNAHDQLWTGYRIAAGTFGSATTDSTFAVTMGATSWGEWDLVVLRSTIGVGVVTYTLAAGSSTYTSTLAPAVLSPVPGGSDLTVFGYGGQNAALSGTEVMSSAPTSLSNWPATCPTLSGNGGVVGIGWGTGVTTPGSATVTVGSATLATLDSMDWALGATEAGSSPPPPPPPQPGSRNRRRRHHRHQRAVQVPYPIASAKMSTLSDTFPGTTVNGTLWNTFNSVSVAEGIVTLTDVTNTASYAGIQSQSAYDLTSSQLQAMLVSSGTAEPSTQACLQVNDGSGNYSMTFMVADGNLQVQVQQFTNYNTVASASYNSATMIWLRMREALGTTYFEYAADGNGPWTNFYSVSDPIPETYLFATIQHGMYNPTDPSTTSQWGMVNPTAPIVMNGVSDTVALGSYTLEVNEFNSTAPMVVTSSGATSPTDFAVPLSALNTAGGGAPGGGTNIFYGNHFGTITPGTGLPLPVAGITPGSVVTSTETTTSSGIAGSDLWDLNYDIWFNASATGNQTGLNANNLELMIWPDYSSGASPTGSLVASSQTVNGQVWDVYFGTGGNGNCLSYKRVTKTSSMTVDIGLFAADAVARGYLNNSWWLIDVEFGSEIWIGGASLAVNSFSVSVAPGVYAGLATAVGAAAQPGTPRTPGLATGTGTALQPSIPAGLIVNAGLATGTGTAQSPKVTIAVSAGLATGTGASAQPGLAFTPGLATGAGTAQPPTVTLTVNAGLATGAGGAQQPSTPRTAALATGTGTAQSPGITLTVNAGLATGTGTAQAPGTGNRTIGLATGTGTAQPPVATIIVNAGLATGTGTALSPTVPTASFAGLAHAAGTAQSPTVTLIVNAGLATGTGTAQSPNTGNRTAGLATGTGTAFSPLTTLTVTAGLATGTGTAQVPGTGKRTAGLARGTGAAFNAVVPIRTNVDYTGSTLSNPNTLGGTVGVFTLDGTLTVAANTLGGTATVASNTLGGTVTVATLGGTLAVTSDTLTGTLSVATNTLGGTAVEDKMQEIDIILNEFNDATVTFQVLNNGSPDNITGMTVNALFKKTRGDLDSAGTTKTYSSGGGSPAITINTPTTGNCTLAIPDADVVFPNWSFYRIDVVNGSVTTTAIFGTVTITLL